MGLSKLAACSVCSSSRRGGAASPAPAESRGQRRAGRDGGVEGAAPARGEEGASSDSGSSGSSGSSGGDSTPPGGPAVASPRRGLRQVVLVVQAALRLGPAAAPEKRRSRQASVLSIFRRRRSCTRLTSDEEMADNIRELMALREPGQALAGLSDFAKEYGDAAFAMRLLRKHDGNVQRSAERYKQALRWREAHRELITTRRFTVAGDNRVIGADSARRPILYMCMRNQLLPGAQGLDQTLVCMLQALDNMPPGVQTATHVWDLHGMSVRMNMNPAPVAQMLQASEAYFADRMHQLIVIDMPRLAGFLKDAVWPLVPERTRQKVKFLTAREAQAHFAGECPAEVAGRIAGAMDQNRDRQLSLEARRASWMRVDARGDLVPAFG